MSRVLSSRTALGCIAVALLGIVRLGAQEQQVPLPGTPAAAAVPTVNPTPQEPPAVPAAPIATDGGQEGVAAANPNAEDVPALSVARPSSAAASDRIRQALANAVVIEFSETPLSEVLAYLQQYCQIPIVIDRKSLDAVGLGPDVTVTISVKGVSLQSALELLLSELQLTYTIRDEVLKITTPEQADSVLETRVYPVADFAVAAPPSLIVPDSYSRYSVLLKLLFESVAPESWAQVGGAGSAWVFEPWGVLVVSQTQGVHEELELLLSALRETRKAASAPGAAAIEGTPAAALPLASQQYLKRMDQVLNSKISLEFMDAPLQEVAAFVAEDRGITVWIDKKALDDVGLGTDTPVTISVKDLTLRSALRMMLEQMELGFTVRHEVLLITTPEKLSRKLVVKVYSVADFLAGIDPAAGGEQANTTMASLQDLIEGTIAPDTWDHVGGAGSLSPVADWGVMVISQMDEVHAQIEELLRMARQARSSIPSQGVAAAVGSVLMAAPAPATILPSRDNPVVMQSWSIAEPVTRLPVAPGLPSLHTDLILKVYAIPDFEGDQLAKAIRGTVTPGSWMNDVNGPAIFTVGTNLLVRHTESGHAQIAQLISGLRPHKGGPVPR